MGQILWVGKNYLLPTAGVKRHTHPYYHMFYIASGSCTFALPGKDSTLTQGQCLLVPPQAEHGYTNDGSGTTCYYEVKFSMPQAGRQPGQIQMESALIGSLLEQILEEYSRYGNLADEAAASYLDAILSLLTQPQRAEKPRPFRYFDASGLAPLSQRIVEYLEAHYSRELSLEELADAMDYNKSYLCVAFKKDAGLTILDCLNTIRIRRAAELIVYSDQTLSQVAALCGFASVSHFNRVFLKYVGTTPGQCRRAFPVDILFYAPESVERKGKPNAFMYSVLAHKQIPPELSRDYQNVEE